MINFRPITLQDRALVQRYVAKSRRQNCDLSFSNLYSWQFLYDTEIAEESDFLFFRFKYDGALNYMFPVGEGSICQAVQLMKEDAVSQGSKVRMMGVCTYVKETIEQECTTGRFEFETTRDRWDYIYLRESLATLSGKKLQPKRNHVNKFKATYPNYEYRPLTPQLVEECLALERQWLGMKEGEHDTSMQSEYQSLTNALTHFEELDLLGGVLYVDGQIVAFTFGNPINANTFDICVEKANREITGAYAMINQLFVQHIPEQYTFINREEDLGIEGLRKAKLSYYPHILLEKHSAELVE